MWVSTWGAVALHCCCCCRRLQVLLGSAGFCAPVQPGARTQPRFWTVEDWVIRSEFRLCCCSSRRSSTPGSLGAPCFLGGGVPPLEEILDPGEGRGLMSGVVVGVLDQNLGVAGLGPEARRESVGSKSEHEQTSLLVLPAGQLITES